MSSRIRMCARCGAIPAVYGKIYDSKCGQVMEARRLAPIRKRNLAIEKEINETKKKIEVHKQAQQNADKKADELATVQDELNEVETETENRVNNGGQTFDEIAQNARSRRRRNNPTEVTTAPINHSRPANVAAANDSIFVRDSDEVPLVPRRSQPSAFQNRRAPFQAFLFGQQLVANYVPISEQPSARVLATIPTLASTPVDPPAIAPVAPVYSPPSPTSEVANSFGEIDVSDGEVIEVDLFCSICQNVEDGEFRRTLCGHEFHEDCLAKHLAVSQENRSRSLCPNCNRVIA